MARALVNTIRDTQKNLVINGNMAISQRGTSFVSPADGVYTLDRWRYGKSGVVSTHTVTQDTDVPTLAQAGYLFQNSLRLNLTAADTSIAAGDISVIGQNIEGYNWANIAQKTFTISFWVKATLPGTYCVGFRNSARDRSYVAEYTINTTATWEYKTITVSASPSSGTWSYTNGTGLEISWVLAAGSTFQTTANSWQTGNFVATANQVNGVNTGATDFRITGVMVTEGSSAGSFRLFNRDVGGEIIACQRYYEKSYELTIAPGTATIVGAFEYLSHNSNSEQRTVQIKVLKRATPNLVTIYSTQTGVAGSFYRVGVGDESATVELSGSSGFSVFRTGGAIAGALFRLNWAVDAEL